MILVADSGSTTTNWVLTENKKTIATFNTSGINPFFTKSEEITEKLNTNIPGNFSPKDITKIYFYGSGCSSPEMNKIVFNGLAPIYTNAEIEINSDLLAAARSLFFKEEGIAAILGTGSGTCFYDGYKIVKNIMPLGYILGNEGGGDNLGKLLITDFLNDELPKDIYLKFNNKYNLSKNKILQAIYKEKYPNRFLASFSNFISSNRENKYMNALIKKSFTALFVKHICKYEDFSKSKLRCSGSVAFHLQSELKDVASKFNITIDLIEKEPISRLVQYHTYYDNSNS